MSIKHLQFDDYGYLAGTSITASFQTVLALSDDADFLFIFNTCDQALIFRLPSSRLTALVRLPAGANWALDCRTNSKRLAKGLVEVKYADSVPTTGEVSVTAAR